MNFARYLRVKEWEKVLFLDEKYNRFGSDGRRHVRRRKGKQLNPKCVQKTVKGGGESVMVLAAFLLNRPGPIIRIIEMINGHSYLKHLQDHLVPHAKRKIGRNYHLLFDNAPCHISKVVRKYIQKHKIKIISFPAQPADINPIENLWCKLDKAIKHKKSSNQNELFQVFEDGWKNILQCRLEKLIESMSRRINAVITNKENLTKY